MNSDSGLPSFGEAMAFYRVVSKARSNTLSPHHDLVVYRPLNQVKEVLRVAICGKWGADREYNITETSQISNIVGIWTRAGSENVYVIRRHPALSLLSPYEAGLKTENDNLWNSEGASRDTST
jgi:hypothetical protein